MACLVYMNKGAKKMEKTYKYDEILTNLNKNDIGCTTKLCLLDELQASGLETDDQTLNSLYETYLGIDTYSHIGEFAFEVINVCKRNNVTTEKFVEKHLEKELLHYETRFDI